MKPYALATVLLAACAIVLLLNHQPARVIGAPAAAKQKWEYNEIRVEDVSILGGAVDPFDVQNWRKTVAAGLNKLGEEGWELVAVPHNGGHPQTYVFKRAK